MKDLIKSQIANYILDNKENWCIETNDRYYDEPLIGFASADDLLFEEYKTIIGSEHFTPSEVFEMAFGTNSYHGGTVISIAVPINEKIRKSNRLQKKWPSNEWGLLHSFKVKGISLYLTEILTQKGYRTVVPSEAEWYKIHVTSKGPISNWSERHVAYVAGLGTFSLNDGFITEKGAAIRLLSFITELKLEPDVRKVKNHIENCLYYKKGACRACMKRCPAGAITENGHDKMKCYRHSYGDVPKKFGVSDCSLCQTNVPCEYKIPN